VLLGAPTGRAAKRLSEATRRPASTVHRLLEWGRRSDGGAPPRRAFQRGDDRPLDADLIVVDEASMLDLPLARALFDAVRPGAQLLLVGDVDQLPSVGPGQVLRDLIDSGAVAVARLTEVFRQAEGSGIVENAHQILRGRVPVSGARDDARADFYLVPAADAERAQELAVRLCKERIPSAFGLDPLRDVQVLSPMHRGAAGTQGLNRALQEALNPGGEPAGDGRLRLGDKVIQLRNDYERDVFNGDVGFVAALAGAGLGDEADAVAEVDFDGRRVRYELPALGDLELAYALSVHKSQGSEYPAVILLMLPEHHVMLQRNLLYTAITRGKRLVVIVGAAEALRRAVATQAGLRSTGLAPRLFTATALGHNCPA
jgi:exodeoxyribonuclease V alpha subunit